MKKGKIIAIEGTTCSGKTEISKKLSEIIEDSVYIKMLPSTNEIGIYIKEMNSKLCPLEIDLLYLEDIYECVKNAKEYTLVGKTVIFDRYFPSLNSFCRRYRTDKIYNNFMDHVDYDKIIHPDLLIVLYSSPEIKIERIKNKKDATEFDKKSINDVLLEQYLHEAAIKFSGADVWRYRCEVKSGKRPYFCRVRESWC